MKVILQPCGNSVAQKNFVDTIEKKIPVNDIYNDLSEVEQEVVNTFPFQEIAVWGVTAGKNNVNKVDWEKINPNDIALFYKVNFNFIIYNTKYLFIFFCNIINKFRNIIFFN